MQRLLAITALFAVTDAMAADPLPPRLLTPTTLAPPHNVTGEAFVTVQVTVAWDGSVVDAQILSGPRPFLPYALEAARALRFVPASEGSPLSIVPVTFHYASSEAPHEPEEAALEIVVQARDPNDEHTHAHQVLDQRDLDRQGGQDLAETLSTVAGITIGRGTADAGKPIIRGQTERRSLVLFDGVRLESQKWGADHATEIDPFAAGEIHVIKGAAGARFGPDAIGGVVLVDPPAMRTEPGVGGRLRLVGIDNGRRGVGALRLDAVSAAVPGLSFRIEGDVSRGASISTPDYVLGNTASTRWNLGGRIQYARDRVTLTASIHHYDLKAGICLCNRAPNIDEFQAQLNASRPVNADDWRTSYTIERPYQDVQHDTAMVRSVIDLDHGELTGTYALQNNQRREFDQARRSIDNPQVDLTLRTHSLDVVYATERTRLGPRAAVEGEYGLAASFQENVFRGQPLIPNHRSAAVGVFGIERFSAPTFDVELGVRYDRQTRTSVLTDTAFKRHASRGSLTEDDCTLTDDTARCQRDFDAASASLGGLWHLHPAVELKIDLSSASRFPNGDELYLNGTAPTSPVYGVGDPGLDPELTLGASPTLGLRFDWLEAEVSAYVNRIDDYILFAPDLAPDGSPAFDVTIQGAFPSFSHRAINSLTTGVDGGFTLGPRAPLAFIGTGAVVRSIDRATGRPLPFVPADRFRLTLRAQPTGIGPFARNTAEVSVQHIARQRRFDPALELAPPPDGVTLLGAAIGVEWNLRGHRTLSAGLEADNLLNTRFRDYTSLLRYYTDEPGREVRLRLGLQF